MKNLVNISIAKFPFVTIHRPILNYELFISTTSFTLRSKNSCWKWLISVALHSLPATLCISFDPLMNRQFIKEKKAYECSQKKCILVLVKKKIIEHYFFIEIQKPFWSTVKKNMSLYFYLSNLIFARYIYVYIQYVTNLFSNTAKIQPELGTFNPR